MNVNDRSLSWEEDNCPGGKDSSHISVFSQRWLKEEKMELEKQAPAAWQWRNSAFSLHKSSLDKLVMISFLQVDGQAAASPSCFFENKSATTKTEEIRPWKASRHNNHGGPLAKQHGHKPSFMIMMPAFPLLNFLFTILSLQRDCRNHKKIYHSAAAGTSFEIRL